MNFDNYIPNKKITILLGGKEISVLSINKFEIDINILQASYEVDIKRINYDFMNVEGMCTWTKLRGRLKIGNFITPCEMTVSFQDPMKLTYGVFLFCRIYQNTEQFYNKNCYLREKQSRFEILDL